MMWLLFGKFYRIIIYEKFLGCGMGKEILTEQRISDDCKKAIRRFFWRSIIFNRGGSYSDIDSLFNTHS